MAEELNDIERLARWYRDAALPLWAKTAWDDAHGGFFEALDFNGNPIRGPRRVRVQSRQVYTFSMAAKRGWRDDAGRLAAQGFDYLLARACPQGGARGCVHTLSDEGAVIDDRRDLYDQAFLLLACASRIETAGCERAHELAEKTMAFLDGELASPHGGWIESDKGELPRRQNPHMHLFEAFMALYRATGEQAWRARADDVVKLFTDRFYDSNRGVLLEFFTDDLTAPDAGKGDMLEPGHMMEWVWLLSVYERMSDQNFSTEKQTLYLTARGFEDADGFLPDSVGSPGADGGRRLWPQTEYVKAALSLAAAADGDYAQDARKVLRACFETYLNQPVNGLWCDRFNADGAPIAQDVPASILYHLYEAVAECLRFTDGEKQS